MTPLYAFAFIIFIFLLGDMVAVKSESAIPSLFAVSVFFLIAFWIGLPATIITIFRVDGYPYHLSKYEITN